MKHFDYLIIGGGLTADAAVRGIRELDQDGSIGLFSIEADPPYSRPKLSKDLWKGKSQDRFWRKTSDRNVDLHLDTRITNIEPDNKTVSDASGAEYTYGKLLLATGCDPVRLPFASENIIYYRNYQDYLHLKNLTEKGDDFLVIGGGFIGSEIAASLNTIGKNVTMVFLEDAIGFKIYPHDLARFINTYYQDHGVEVLSGDAVDTLADKGDKIAYVTRTGKQGEVDGVVIGIGVKPDLTLAEQIGLKIDNGIVVDEQLRTSSADIYAAGDAANFYHSQLKKRVRVEHEDNALKSGKLAGRNMAGAAESYTHVPAFYSDIFDLWYEAVGELDSRLETIADWEEPFRKGVIYYLEDGKARGVLLWKIMNAKPAALEILAEAEQLSREDLTLEQLTKRIVSK